MCNSSVINFIVACLKDQIIDKEILDVGAFNVNGSARNVLFGFKKYTGVDLLGEPENGVDMICDAVEVEKIFGKKSFDIVISTEMLEHCTDWKAAIHNLKTVTRDALLVTTRSPGTGYHNSNALKGGGRLEWGGDYWRFTVEDFSFIFDDFEIIKIEKDVLQPGVMIYCKRPRVWIEKDLAEYTVKEITK